MSNCLCMSFDVGSHVWIYDAVTNRIWRKSNDEILYDIPEKILEIPCSDDSFSVEKMVFRTTKQQYLEELDSCMTHLMLEITQDCTLRCSYCIYSGNYEGERTHTKRHMDFQTAMDAIAFFESHSKKTKEPIISFYGGEALLEFDMIRRIVEQSVPMFGGRRVLFNIATNGTTLSEDVCKWLNNHDYVMIDLTLNGYVQDRYRRFKNGDGSLSSIEKKLFNIRKNYPDVFHTQLRFICNYADAVELIDIMKYYDTNEIVPTLVTSIVRERGNDVIQSLGVSEQEHQQAWEKLKQSYYECPTPYTRVIFDSSMLRIHGRSSIKMGKNVKIEHCCFPFMTNCYVDVSGQLTLCEKMSGTERFGDIYSGIDMTKLMQLMKEYADLRNMYCKGCWAQRLCTRCFADMNDVSSFTQPCDTIRQNILEELTMYCYIYENAPVLFDSFSDIVRHTDDIELEKIEKI